MSKRTSLKVSVVTIMLLAFASERIFSQLNSSQTLPQFSQIRLIANGSQALNSDTGIIVVEKGWNLISLPLTVQDGRKNVLFPTARSEAFTYLGGYKVRDTLQSGVGYWLKFAAPETIAIVGNYRHLDTVVLRRGWNLIGSMLAPIPAWYLIYSPPGITASDYFGYQHDSGYTTATKLNPGKGYWVNVSQAGKLIQYCPVEHPIVRLVPPLPSLTESLYVLKQVTDTWNGIKFYYQGRDRISRWLWYSWRVDSVAWSVWGTSTTAIITASDMDQHRPYTGVHTFEVRAKNEFGLISSTDSMSVASFLTVYPAFAEPGYPQRVLLINSAKPGTGASPWLPTTKQVSDYYKEIFDSIGVAYDVWETETRGTSSDGHPTLSDLGRYSTLFLFSDICPLNEKQKIRSSRYSSYMDVGGNMIMNGGFWALPPQVYVYPIEPFLITHIHLASITYPDYLTITASDFIGAFGNSALNYPAYVELDSSKLNPAWSGGLKFIAVSAASAFGEIIFRYDSRNDSVFISQPNGDVIPIEGHSIGYLYRGATFKTTYFGIPLYFVKKDQAIAILRRTIELFYP
jgi:hypothetical protein